MPATTGTLSDYEKERGKPLPSFNHGTIQALLIGALLQYRDEFSIVSELSLELPREDAEANGDRVARTDALRVTPDISVYPRKEVDWLHDVVRMTEPPLVAVEIVSPTQSQQDVVDKIQAMLGAGVQSCWFVQPVIRAVTLFADDSEASTVTAGTFEDPATGIRLDVTALFEQH